MPFCHGDSVLIGFSASTGFAGYAGAHPTLNLGDEMYYRYQQSLIDEAMTTVGACYRVRTIKMFRRFPPNGPTVSFALS